MAENPQRQKVLFLITKSDFGGAQRYVFDLATNLPREHYEPIVATGGNGALIDKLKVAGVRVIPITSLQRDISLKQEFRSLREISHIIKTERPNVLHVNSSKAGGLGTLLGRIYRVPRIIFTAHGWAFNEDRGLAAKLALKFLHWVTVLLSHQTIAVSEAIKQQLNWPLVQQKMVVIHNGRTHPVWKDRTNARQYLASQNDRLRKYQDDIWTMTIAELHPVKQHEVAIQAINELVEEGFSVRHLIIGDGELQADIASLIKELELIDHVFLMGRIDEAAQYLKAADIFILPSRSEALAYAAVEALQAGVPTVASDVGGLPEIITDGQTGFLVPSGDVSELTHRLRELLTDTTRREQMSQQATKQCQRFSMTAMIDHTITVYGD